MKVKAKILSYGPTTSTCLRAERSELMLPILEIAASSCGNSRYLSAIAQELMLQRVIKFGCNHRPRIKSDP